MKIYPKRSYKENGKNSEENFAKKNHDLTFFFYKFIINYVVSIYLKDFKLNVIFEVLNLYKNNKKINAK